MSASGLGLGRVFNVIHEASGLDVPLTRASAVTFVSFLAAGTQALTITQTDSTGTESETALNPDADKVYNGPGVGGTWQTGPTPAANVVTNADATNDCLTVTVTAAQLADGYDSVQCTAATGTCVAIIHDLVIQRTPGNLASSLTA